MTKNAIVIGATSGIGKAVAVQLAESGYRVGITGRRGGLLDKLRRAYPDRLLSAEIDNTETSTLEEKLESLRLRLGPLDLVILSSGVGNINPELQFSIEKETVDLNVKAFTQVADWVMKVFREQGYGHFAAITSIAGLTSSALAPAYYASKAYQINYLKGLRKAVRRSKLPVVITDIRPGFVDTAMAKGEGLIWVAPVDKAASQIIRAIRRKKSIVYITKRWAIAGWLLKLLPG